MTKQNFDQSGGDIKRIAETIRLITDNFRIFTSEVIGLRNAPFHNEIDDCLSCELNKKLCIALPRGHGKSTHLSVAYPLWEIGKNHNSRILLVSNSAEISRRYMTEITGHIERNQKYQLWSKAIDPKGIGVAPKMKSRQAREEHWASDSIIINRDDIKLKDPTINAVGLFGSIISRRADIVIVDDLVDQQNSSTEEQRQKIKDWVYTTLMPVLVPGGRFIYLGNTWHMDDLISNLLKDPQFDVRKRVPAIIHEASRQDLWEEWANIQLDESLTVAEKKDKAGKFYADRQKEMSEGIEVLWPERYPYPDLYMMRVANPYAFARMYQCDPSIRPNQKFLESDIEKAIRKGRDMVLQDEPRSNYETAYTASGLDLAISQKAWSDDTAFVSLDRVKSDCGEVKTGDYIIRNIERGKFLPKEVVDRVSRHYYAVNPIGIRVESVAYQESLILDLGERGIPVRSYKTGAEKNDPDIGVNSLAVLLSQGKLVLPYSNKDARTRQLVTQLINEMRAYPEGHSGDSLMALWFAFSEIREYGNHEIYFARIDGNDFCTSGTIKNNDQEIPKESETGIQTKKLEMEKIWKNDKEQKALGHQADLDCIRKDEFYRRG